MKILFTFYLCFILSGLSAQGKLREVYIYEDKLYSKRVCSDEEIPAIDSLKVLIVDFQDGSAGRFQQTLLNNPQLVEIHLINTPVAALKTVSGSPLEVLKYLIIVGYKGDVLEIRSTQFPMLQSLSVASDKAETLFLESTVLNALMILSIDMPELKNWKSPLKLEKLELIDLTAPKLEEFPLIDCPGIYQFSMRCSLNAFPAGFCDFRMLHLASFTNYKVIPVPSCISKRVKKKCYYSNISIYDGRDGKLVEEVLSRDRRK